MGTYDERRTRIIETPADDSLIEELMYNQGTKDEHWAVEQDFNFNIGEDASTGFALGQILKEYAVARKLIQDGYKFEMMLEPGVILWINYTSTSNDNITNQN